MTPAKVIPKHVYTRDPRSGAGNCWCGRAEASRLHPHEFTPASVDPMRCVCGGFANDAMHIDPGRWLWNYWSPLIEEHRPW